ncbi:RING/U-box superfamily protein, putative isoform 1 [Quillaja saponaria]|uniref:RING/U-box superfamily protein, putative isoform 1 n=1 Tax=Quillaja saponaria TaxID=32244 RepID=A0AAD7QES7_QUISA|nr:RING/U-box superfamily protein, putative isoform 1 [Quillaja saponaria]
MASLVASSSSSQVSPSVSVQEKGSRNKRKFRADPPLGEPNKIVPSPQNECLSYEFSAEKFEIAPGHGQANPCDLCCCNQDHSDGLKLDLGLSSSVGLSEFVPNQSKEEAGTDEFHDADWSDLTEAQLEELVLSNLDTIFKSAIKKIVACGYTEEVATKAILRSGICYGCKDTISNIVDNTLAFLRNGKEIDPSREHHFEDLQQLEKYILAELVCVLREVRPFFSTGDAMWCLLICDMNVSHACAMDGDPISSFVSDGTTNECSSLPTLPQLKTETKSHELNLANPCKTVPSSSCSHNSLSEVATGVSNMANSKNCQVVSGLISEKEGMTSASYSVDKSSGTAGTSQSHTLEEKFGSSRKVHSGSSKRDYILRQKSFHVEKGFRTYGSKGSSRVAKMTTISGFIADKKGKPIPDPTAVNLKSASSKISKATGVDVSQDNLNLSTGASSAAAFNLDTVDTNSRSPKSNISSSSPAVNTSPALPALNNPTALSATDTDLSLSLSSKNKSSVVPIICNTEELNSSYAGIPYDKSLGQWVPRDKKDEMILKLVPRVRELQNQLQEWTEWANQKVMQAARRLGKDKAELKTLRQEKEEVERLKKEKHSLEENTMKKLSEMENALCKASGQVERANAAVRRLEVENAALRLEMEAAKLRAAESAASCQEEELVAEKRKLAQLLQELEQAKVLQEQSEARWEQEQKAKEELLMQASSIRKEKEQTEASAKSKEEMIKLRAEKNLQRYIDEILRHEKEISQLRLKTDSWKIAALKKGIDGSYTSRTVDVKHGPTQKETQASFISELVSDYHDYSGTGGVKRERECVMCLSEEMSVVFLPCAHQVVCTTCNELHEKQGMKDCPSCRSPIQRRISVRYART